MALPSSVLPRAVQYDDLTEVLTEAEKESNALLRRRMKDLHEVGLNACWSG